MSVSIRRSKGLPPGIWGPGADGMGRIMVPATPPGQMSANEGEIPIASFNDESAADTRSEADQTSKPGTAQVSYITAYVPYIVPTVLQREESESLPSSSPISVSSVETESMKRNTVPVNGAAQSQRSDSAPLWDALSPIPRRVPGPGETLFDEYESAGFEDGEVVDPEAAVKTPPSNQAASYWTDEERQDFAGKPSGPSLTLDALPTGRKRNWGGSPASEEMSRTARRPRRDEDEGRGGYANGGDDVRLPSIQEMMGNPWQASSGTRARCSSFRPAVVSTPKREQARTHVNFVPDSAANVSGAPPSPFSTSSTGTAHARPLASPFLGGAQHQPPRHVSRQPRFQDEDERARPEEEAEEMDIDGAELLRPCERGRRDDRRERPRGRAWSQGQGPRSLYDIIADSNSSIPNATRAGDAPRWQGGYAPRFREERTGAPNRSGLRKTIDEWEDERSQAEEATRTHDKTPFSAIPHTRAWQYRADRAPVVHEMGRYKSAGPQDDADDWPEDGHRSAFPSSGGSGDDADWQEATRGYQGSVASDDHDDDWAGYAGATPSALANDLNADDTPVLVNNPKSSKWHVHFGDPEFLLTGLAGGWINTIWNDERPVVVFWVYNYKYTDNGVINRHIETSVHEITSRLTGEDGFCVVPPDPDTTRNLPTRELPFLWAIRGLTESGAKLMTTAHLVTTKNVTIITMPRALCIPRWVCALGGFLRPNVSIIRAAVLSVLESKEMLALLVELTMKNRRLRHIPPEERVDYIISSIQIKMTEAEDGEPVANIFMHPPTDDMNLWRDWVARMRREKYNIFMNGTGKARRIFWCSGCRGVDHETDECRLTEMEGWKGPNPSMGDKLHTTIPILEMARKKKYDNGKGLKTNALRGSPARGRWQGAGGNARHGAGGLRSGHRGGGPRGNGSQRGGWSQRAPSGWTPGHSRDGRQGWPGTYQDYPQRW